MNLYVVTETDQANKNLNTTSLVIAHDFEDAAREFVLNKRYLRNDLEIINEGLRSLLFVTPSGQSLDEAGVIAWDPKAARLVPFERDWLASAKAFYCSVMGCFNEATCRVGRSAHLSCDEHAFGLDLVVPL